MASITGIELGIDSCVLVRTRQVRGATEVAAIHAVYAAEWPSQDEALAALLRRARREKRLPRRARVVAWHLPESASMSDPATRAALRPLAAAGFRVDAVLSPPRALALLAASRPRPGDTAAAWLALNRHGVAIAIVRGSELLFSREFDWSYKGTAGGTNAQLLERYSLVAHLAPELRRGIDMVRAGYIANVDSAITCGDLPDLRSLTMPLIEELDLEVETLDSTDGLVLTSNARAQRGTELAPALRLACAAAARAQTERRAVPRWLKGAAAAVVVLAGAAWIYSRWPAMPAATNPPSQASGQTRPVRPRAVPKPATTKPATEPTRPVPVNETAAASPGAAKDTPVTTPAKPQAPPAAVPSAASARAGAPAAPPRNAASAPVSTPQPKAAAPLRQTAEGVASAQPPPAARKPAPADQPAPAPRTAQPAPKLSAPPADTTRAEAPPPSARPKPLNAPVPSVSSILISSDRRLAVIDGRIMGVGETVGPRVVARIEPSFVVLREPSGFELKVPLR